MDEKIISLLRKIKEDCFDLEKNNDITDFGRGQQYLINLILAEL